MGLWDEARHPRGGHGRFAAGMRVAATRHFSLPLGRDGRTGEQVFERHIAGQELGVVERPPGAADSSVLVRLHPTAEVRDARVQRLPLSHVAPLGDENAASLPPPVYDPGSTVTPGRSGPDGSRGAPMRPMESPSRLSVEGRESERMAASRAQMRRTAQGMSDQALAFQHGRVPKNGNIWQQELEREFAARVGERPVSMGAGTVMPRIRDWQAGEEGAEWEHMREAVDLSPPGSIAGTVVEGHVVGQQVPPGVVSQAVRQMVAHQADRVVLPLGARFAGIRPGGGATAGRLLRFSGEGNPVLGVGRSTAVGAPDPGKECEVEVRRAPLFHALQVRNEAPKS